MSGTVQRVTNIRTEVLTAEWIINNANSFIDASIKNDKLSMPNFLRSVRGNWTMGVELVLDKCGTQAARQSQAFYGNQYASYATLSVDNSASTVAVCVSFHKLKPNDPVDVPHTMTVALRDAGGQNHLVELKPLDESKKLRAELTTLNSIKQNRERWIPNNRLQISFSISQCYVENLYDPNMERAEQTPDKQGWNFAQLWQTKDFSDCEIFVHDSNKKLDTHKIVLAASSHKFAATLKSEAKNRIEIRGYTSELVEEFLYFFYFGGTRESARSMATSLLTMAKAYEVDELSKHCEEILCSQLTAANAAEYLQLASKQQAETLSNAAKNYIVAHFQQVLETAGWTSLLQNNVKLANGHSAAKW